MPAPHHPRAPSCRSSSPCCARASSPASARGLTLVELLVAIALLGVLAALAVPAFADLRERQSLRAVASRLEGDIHHARGMAVARHQVVRLSFEVGTDAACWIVHTGDPDDCRCAADGSAQCGSGGEALRAVRVDVPTPVSLQPNARSLAFDPVRGTVTPAATIRLRTASGRAIHQIVNVTGRVRACSPDGSLASLRSC